MPELTKILKVPVSFAWNERETINLEAVRDRLNKLAADGPKHTTLADLWQVRDVIEALMFFDVILTPNGYEAREKEK